MKPWRWLIAPWVAARSSMRWLTSVVVALSTLGAVLIIVFHAGPDGPTAAVYAWCVGLGLLWVFFLPNMLLMTMAARSLCLPGIRRDVAASLGLYAVLSIVVPTLLLACVGANALTVVLVLSLAACTCLLYALAPWYMAFAFCVVPLLADRMSNWLDLPGPSRQGFASWAAVSVVAMAVCAVLRWRQLMRCADIHTHGLRRPLILGLNRDVLGVGAAGATDDPDALHLLRQRADWLQRRIDLRHTGPRFPRRALRVALGGVLLPQTWKGRLCSLIPVGLAFCVFALVSLIGTGDHGQRGHVLVDIASTGHFFFVDLFIALAGAIVVVMVVARLKHLWRSVNTELPLLALLPGLGDSRQARRALLRATLTWPLTMLAGVLLALLAMAAATRMSLLATTFLVLVPAGCGGMAVVLVVGIMGGWPTRLLRVCVTAIVAATCILTSLSVCLPILLFPALNPHQQFAAACALALAWLLLAVVMGGVGRRGWREYHRRPHPFLANA
jgi:hypothetical protein